MIRRCSTLLLPGLTLGSLIVVYSMRVQGQAPPPQDHTTWVADSLKRMQQVKPGMTHNDWLKVFTTEGGIFTNLNRTYVSRDCPYFKVNVEFNATGRLGRNPDGTITFGGRRTGRVRENLQASVMD